MVATNERARAVAWMPSWPGAKKVVELAIAGGTDPNIFQQMCVGAIFPDKSRMIVEYQLTHLPSVPDYVYGHAGEPPLLCITVEDRGAGMRLQKGLFNRVAPHMAEQYLQDIANLFGSDAKLAVANEGIDHRHSRRRYWWRVQ